MDETLRQQQEIQASQEVAQAMQAIAATEAQVSQHFGLPPDDPELPILTDEALVHVAEQSVDQAKEQPETQTAADAAVENVLIEGALESTGQRPVNEHNPIVTLDADGYYDIVTEKVAEMRTHGTTVQGGKLVAEVAAETIDDAETQLAARIKEIVTISNDPGKRQEATERNSHVTIEDVWQPSTLHHSTAINNIAQIIKDGQLTAYMHASWRTLRMTGPLNFGVPVKDLPPDATQQQRVDNLSYSRFGGGSEYSVYLHYDRSPGCYREGEEYKRPFEDKIIYMDGGMPATEISAMTVDNPGLVGRIRDELVTSNMYVPVFDHEGKLAYSRQDFDTDVQALENGTYTTEDVRQQQAAEQKEAKRRQDEQEFLQRMADANGMSVEAYVQMKASQPIERPPM